ncbi:MAG: hypothetical protein HYY14_04515 [Candidatus Omnitrophica bacterium]|nr:hypothetical protein [Candidatus Omnitrophota bacterium]
MKQGAIWILLAALTLMAAGCGETVRGAGNDVRRMGRGFKTIFVSD